MLARQKSTTKKSHKNLLLNSLKQPRKLIFGLFDFVACVFCLLCDASRNLKDMHNLKSSFLTHLPWVLIHNLDHGWHASFPLQQLQARSIWIWDVSQPILSVIISSVASTGQKWLWAATVHRDLWNLTDVLVKVSCKGPAASDKPLKLI